MYFYIFIKAGVKGIILRFLGTFDVINKTYYLLNIKKKKVSFFLKNIENKKRTDVFVMLVEKEFDEWEDKTKYGRIRKWFSFNDAKIALKSSQSFYLDILKKTSNIS
jgi:hypothetical protein